jgi:hypothetical protein
MTVIADDKKRITLPTKPGARFDLQAHGEDKFILTRLVTAEPPTVKLIKKHGYTVAVNGRKITSAEVRKLLDEFP